MRRGRVFSSFRGRCGKVCLVRDSDSTQQSVDASKPAAGAALRITLIGLLVSVGLATVKLIGGVVGNSSALVADAIESFADSASSLVVLQGIRVARKPPDEDHPYGHGKAEAVSALIVCVLLLVAAGFIAVESAQQILTPHGPPKAWTLIVLGGVVLVKEVLFRVVGRIAEREASNAAHADAWHHRADAITSVAAFVGVTLAVWGPGWFGSPQLVYADEVAAIVASGIIVYTALRLLHDPLHELLDAAPADLLEEIRTVASSVEGVRGVEKVLARKSGPKYLVDMHLHVDATITIREAHAIGGKVRATVRQRVPRVRDVLTHVEPV